MKTINRSKLLTMLVLSASLLFSCGGNETPDNTPATVETLAATDITDVSAICMGKITHFGSGTIVKQGIELDSGDGAKLDYPSTSSSEEQFSVFLKGLTPSHKYNYRAYVDDGTMRYGQTKSFTTLSAQEPPAPEYTVAIVTSSLTESSVKISIAYTGKINEWGVFYNEREITEANMGKRVASKTNTIVIGDLKHSTLYEILPFVTDTKDEIIFLEKQTFTTEEGSYNNPVIGTDAPDPSVIRAHDGKFYLYHTGVGVHRSDNLVNWTRVGNAFTSNPNWEPGGGVWAPDVNYINGKYVMYYSLSVWGGEWTCGIGIATSDTPEGPFTDRGKLFRSNEIDVQNSIDPCYVEENGRKYLFWGSFRGIYAIELSDDGLALKEGAVKQQVAGTAYEGVYIHKRGSYYYMFASWGSCCNGFDNSNYTTVVGRSASLLGPYVSKSGERMMNNKHEILIQGNNEFKGTGHNSGLITDSNGDDWFFYHAYKRGGGNNRMAMMDKITWVNDWPVVNNGTPTSKSKMPVFK